MSHKRAKNCVILVSSILLLLHRNVSGPIFQVSSAVPAVKGLSVANDYVYKMTKGWEGGRGDERSIKSTT